MSRYVIKVSAITTIILLTLSSSALASDDSSLVARLFNWFRSNIPVFRLEEQRTEREELRAGSKERREKSQDQRTSCSKLYALSSKLSALSSMQAAKLLEFYNYPNPFIPDLGTDFICKLDGDATLELKIFDMDGSLVRKLSWGASERPPHWDGEDTIGRTVRTGMYIYFLKVTDAITGEVTDTKYGKMMAWYMDF